MQLKHTTGAGPWGSRSVPQQFRTTADGGGVHPSGGDMANCPELWDACGLSEYVAPVVVPDPPEVIEAKRQASKPARLKGYETAYRGLKKKLNLPDETTDEQVMATLIAVVDSAGDQSSIRKSVDILVQGFHALAVVAGLQDARTEADTGLSPLKDAIDHTPE